MDSIKQITAQITAAAASVVVGSPLSMNLGNLEIAELVKIVGSINFTVIANNVKLAIYRKNDINDLPSVHAADAVRDNNMVFWGEYDSGLAAYTGNTRQHINIDFPPGLWLVRSPMLVVRPSNADNITIIFTLYYRIKRVTKEELSRLLMKFQGR